MSVESEKMTKLFRDIRHLIDVGGANEFLGSVDVDRMPSTVMIAILRYSFVAKDLPNWEVLFRKVKYELELREENGAILLRGLDHSGGCELYMPKADRAAAIGLAEYGSWEI